MQERLDYEWSGHNHRMDSIRKAALVEIGGDFSDINQFYNTNVRSATITMGVQGNDFSIMIKNASTPSQVESILDSLIQIELSQIERLNEPMLLEKDDYKRVTPEIKKFLVNDVYAFYGSVFLNGMFLKRTEQVSILLQDPEAPYTVYNKDWETLIEAFLKNASKRISPAANSEGYIQFLFNVKHTLDSYQEYDHNPELDYDKLILESLIDPDWSGLDSLSLIDQKAIFVSELQTLMRFLQEQTSYSPVLISAIKEMKKRYPKSGYFDTFDPYIKQVEEYIRSSSEDYNEAIFFEKNYLYFSDLIENLKGKNVLVDIWATWCAPCISDFTYKSILNPFIESEELVILYLSIDKPSWENRWKENIIYNRLKGYHVLANKALILDVWSFLKGTTGVIPRYALIDKEGDIFLSEAARPSESGLLEEQVRQLINSYKE